MPITEQTLMVGEGGRVVLNIARPRGARIRVVVLDEPDSAELAGEERFQLAALASITADDADEDAIWASYLHD